MSSVVIIDVREHEEVAGERIPGAVQIPFSRFSADAPAVLSRLRCERLVFMCQKGGRADLAAQEAGRWGLQVPLETYKGGIVAWKKAGREVISGSRGLGLPIMRQVQITAGSLVVAGVALSFTVDPRFALLSGFVGAGLVFAGATGFCGMAKILTLLPWNKTGSTACAASAGNPS